MSFRTNTFLGGYSASESTWKATKTASAARTTSPLSPIAWLYVGKRLYGAAGVGVSFSDGFEDDISDPFWTGRVGFEFHLLPRTTVDINANYRAGSFDELDQADTDSITLGAMIRWSF